MKNLLLALSILGFVTNVSAQEAADKDVQAGLILGYGMTLQKMGTKLMEKNGIGSDLTIGANVIFSLTETIGFCTGVEFDFESLKYKAPADNPAFYYYKDSDNSLVRQGDVDGNTDLLYQMTTRTQRPMFLTIPTMLMFRTNFIGYFRYFGKFGLRTSVLLSNKITDTGMNMTDVNGPIIDYNDNKDMTAKGEMFPVKSAVGLSGGAEWNFTGSTCLVAEIGYYYGFTPLHTDKNSKPEKTYLFNSGGINNGSGNDVFFSNQATQSQLMFKLSILF